MIIVGDKIKLIKPMGIFDNVGEVCEVVNITNDGSICFKFGKYHLGCMSYDEYLKYFEKVEKRQWTNWTCSTIEFYDPIFENRKQVNVGYRHNGKIIEIRHMFNNDIKAKAKCHKIDEFDFEEGYKLAKKRFIVEYLNYEVKELAKKM